MCEKNREKMKKRIKMHTGRFYWARSIFHADWTAKFYTPDYRLALGLEEADNLVLGGYNGSLKLLGRCHVGLVVINI